MKTKTKTKAKTRKHVAPKDVLQSHDLKTQKEFRDMKRAELVAAMASLLHFNWCSYYTPVQRKSLKILKLMREMQEDLKEENWG